MISEDALNTSFDHFWKAYFAFTDSSILADQTPGAMVAKFSEEAGEFIGEPSVDEAIDCMAVLMFWMHRQGIEPEAVARRAHERLEVWKKRSWAIDESTGAYHHTAEG